MLLEKNVVGKTTDWANYITLADEHETPLLRLLPKGPAPVNTIRNYQADTYDTPAPNAWPEGKDWSTFKTAGANRVPLSARIQWFVKTAAVGKLAEDVTDAAGITSELARETTKKMTELAREMECAAASDQVGAADDGQTGHMFRSIGKWLSSTFTADADTTPAASVLPAAAQILTTALTSMTEDGFKAILQSMWNATGSKSTKIGVVGASTKSMFSTFQFYTPSSTPLSSPTQSTARVTSRSQGDRVLGGMVDRYESDWGPVELHLTKYNQAAGFTGASATYAPYRSYFLNPDRWEWCWKQKPQVYKPEFAGGSYKVAIDAIIMLVCRNPVGEGKWAPAS